MSGIQIEISGLERLQDRLAAIADLKSDHDFLDAIGAEIESQTHRRIREEKTAPDGQKWPKWSDDYAATRHGGHSLLMGHGELDDSIQFDVDGDEVLVGSNLIYAAIHQFGGAEVGIPIPARPYLGLSPENLEDLEAVIDDFIQEAAA